MASPGFVGLRELVRTVVQRDVLRACAAQSSNGRERWMVLVLDTEASRVLSPVLGMYDLMEERVTLVESLEKRRQPFPEMDVIYVAAAEDRSARAIAADWKGRSDAPYAEAHVFFLSSMADSQLALLSGTAELTSRLRTLSELNLDFLAVESQAYTLGLEHSFALSAEVAVATLGSVVLGERECAAARKLATLCATLGEFEPCVRYRAGNARAQHVGVLVLEELAKVAARVGASPSCDREHATVLILDRADDTLTPLLHEYSYQALVQDVLEVEGDARDRVLYAKATKSGEKKDEHAMLNEKDALWVEMRHVHVAKVIDALRRRVADFLENNKGAADLSRGAGSELSLGEMAQALKKMPEFQAATAALNKHMTLAHECLSKFQAASLLEVSQLEQTLATGCDEDGERVRPPDLLGDVVNAASTAGRAARGESNQHALRLVATFIVAQGGRLTENERSRLFSAMNPTKRQQSALLSLARLVANAGGVPTQVDARRAEKAAGVARAAKSKADKAKSGKGSSFAALKLAMKSAMWTAPKNLEEEDEVAGSRYAPPSKALLEALAEDKLSEEMYPSCSDRPASKKAQGRPTAQSVRNRGNRFAAASKQTKSFQGPRIIVLVLGGATYSELRVAYEVSQATNREVIIGGTSLLAPNDFIDMLAA